MKKILVLEALLHHSFRPALFHYSPHSGIQLFDDVSTDDKQFVCILNLVASCSSTKNVDLVDDCYFYDFSI